MHTGGGRSILIKSSRGFGKSLKFRYFRHSGFSKEFKLYHTYFPGFCTMLKPQLSFNDSLNHLPYMDKMFGNFSHNWFIAKGAKVGKANGQLLFSP